MKCEEVKGETECTEYILPIEDQEIKGSVQGQLSCILSCVGGSFEYSWKDDICICKNKQVIPRLFR